MNRLYRPIFLLLMVCGLAACVSVEYTKDAVLERGNAIAQLRDELEQARGEEMELTAPIAMQAAVEKYALALETAKDTVEVDAGVAIAREGLADLERARAQAVQSRQVLRRAYMLRNRVLDAEATEHYPERFEDAEEALTDAARQLEQGDAESARAARDELIPIYNQLELDSLKKGLSAQAVAALQEARDVDADKYAPKSFELARQQLALMEQILEVDKAQLEKAQFHAAEARYLAARAVQITRLVKSFERRDFSREDMVLWYHQQLDVLGKKLNKDLAYDKTNRELIDELGYAVTRLQTGLKDRTRTLAEKQSTIDKLEQELVMTMVNDQREAYVRESRRARFTDLEESFSADEAVVVQNSDAVVIQAHGIYFPVDSADIEVQNYPLLSKLVGAIGLFDNAKIKVYGHTDATGSRARNLRLSKERAANVKLFLTTVGMLAPDRVAVNGFGELYPVASNENDRGRALNRRIDIHIMKP
ncbi:OmpA family protein [Exilibacterium tricleocarpae]|uniref:OmpA family protein n=1 Tax=Exilibacterium tricleocarpae TaxID=2591008 RepID=A0A545TNK9_9GAMM|nr:OmpA family protein [Exilibacterium tricleocarpae]TQV78813.1 OmpA family protein [Exilibacterium tricleocarpae]